MNIIWNKLFNKQKILIFIPLLVLIIVSVKTIPSYKEFLFLINKSREIENIYNNWLKVKSEITRYILSEKNYRTTYTLMKSISKYEVSMDILLNKKLFNKIYNNYDDEKLSELVEVILIWQKIEFGLVKSIFYSDSFDFFVNEFYDFTSKSKEFELKFKILLDDIDLYLKKKLNITGIL